MTGSAIPNGVIVAENDALMRGVLRSMLQWAGQQVFPVADGLEAVNLARTFKARLVLLDIGMPRLNGLLACEAIHALPGYQDVPIIMLTGYDDGRFRLAAQRLGATAFITKPFRPIMLLAQLAAYLDVPGDVLLPIGAAAGDVPLGGCAQEWKANTGPGSVFGENQHFATGRDVVRICRDAEAGAGGQGQPATGTPPPHAGPSVACQASPPGTAGPTRPPCPPGRAVAAG